MKLNELEDMLIECFIPEVDSLTEEELTERLGELKRDESICGS